MPGSLPRHVRASRRCARALADQIEAIAATGVIPGEGKVPVTKPVTGVPALVAGVLSGAGGGGSGDPCRLATLTSEQKAAMPCRFFPKGTCAGGDQCPFSHAAPLAAAAAEASAQASARPQFAAADKASKGCFQMAQTGECRRGDSCEYSHQEVHLALVRRAPNYAALCTEANRNRTASRAATAARADSASSGASASAGSSRPAGVAGDTTGRKGGRRGQRAGAVRLAATELDADTASDAATAAAAAASPP